MKGLAQGIIGKREPPPLSVLPKTSRRSNPGRRATLMSKAWGSGDPEQGWLSLCFQRRRECVQDQDDEEEGFLWACSGV